VRRDRSLRRLDVGALIAVAYRFRFGAIELGFGALVFGDRAIAFNSRVSETTRRSDEQESGEQCSRGVCELHLRPSDVVDVRRRFGDGLRNRSHSSKFRGRSSS
jgi:hypothetical protein